jgi:hypothetical protein
VHEEYVGFKSQAAELQARLQLYKEDQTLA